MFEFAIIVLFALAISDLIVGVSNDAVNFLNSSIGSRVAPRTVIMIIASLGMLAGVMFSSGMMEVARKGIFHPQFFTMPELMTIFLAVMLTDIILLDLYNTFGLPTSTTVSIVFELLGAAVAVSLLKISQAGEPFRDVVNYINTAKAMAIIFGILLSIVVAFIVGALVQIATRLLFTFDYEKRMKRYGALWSGAALSAIIYFILIKGSKGASFITPETLAWIKGHTGLILLASFAVFTVLLQFLMTFTRVHILKVVVLVGTFALAMAFAANDLVNFIGVPLAGLAAYSVAGATADPMTATMEALTQPVRSNTVFLLIAGLIMVVTLWLSRKARSVTKTEVRLGRQEEGYERFESTGLSRAVVRLVSTVFTTGGRLAPSALRRWTDRRLDRSEFRPPPAADGTVPSFDLVRAAVNLMVASALISLATSLKLPLSTTYVTFMVAMGTSFSDQAWGRDSAVYRVSGVLTVIGGWFFTAMMAFTVSGVFAVIIYFGKVWGIIAIGAVAILLLVRTHGLHRVREKEETAMDVFNLRKISDATSAARTTFEHTGIFLCEVRKVLEITFSGLFALDRSKLKTAREGQKELQRWSNIIAANIFKVLRLLGRGEKVGNTERFAQTISSLQEITESARDVAMRAYVHVSNHHSGLLDSQIEELNRISQIAFEILDRTSETMLSKATPNHEVIAKLIRELRELVHEFDQNQILRIQDNSSKTRLSILSYSLAWDCLKIAEHTASLQTVFEDPFRPTLDDTDDGSSPVEATA
jgi:phosphate/sulfate permease